MGKKKVVLFITLALHLMACKSNSKLDKKVEQFISDHTRFTSMSDEIKLPSDLRNYHLAVTDFFQTKHIPIELYYINPQSVENDSLSVGAFLIHYNNFAKLKNHCEQHDCGFKSQTNETLVWFTPESFGFSEDNMYLVVNKKSNKVIAH